MKKIISLRGCDSETEFLIDLTQKEIEFLKEISLATRNVSAYPCMPTLIIFELNDIKDIEYRESLEKEEIKRK